MSIVRRLLARIAGEPRHADAGGVAVAARPRREIPDTPEARELSDKVAAIPFWFHSLDLGHGVITPGRKRAEIHDRELASFRLPDLRGKSVLDIGAWDGFYSFAAERLGAARVVALDRHVWALDRSALARYMTQCKKDGVPPQPPYLVPDVWREDQLPGKRGFNLAREALGSRVESVVDDFMKMDLEPIGTFDVVFYLGVLYHMENPLEALRRVRRVTKEVMILETEAVAIGGFESRPLCEFFPLKAKLGNDPSNFWSPNEPGLVGLCETAGFRRVEVLTPPPAPAQGQVARYRLVAHAFV